MGEAKRRGTFEERKAQSIACKEEADRLSAEAEEKRIAEMDVEELEEESYSKAKAQQALVNISSIAHAVTKGQGVY